MDVLSQSEGRRWRYWAGNGVVDGRKLLRDNQGENSATI